MTVPDDCSFTVPDVNDDESDLGRGNFDDFRPVDVHTVGFQRCESKLSFGIRSKTTGVRRLKAKSLQTDHCRCRLTTSRLHVVQQTHLCVEGWILGYDYQVIDRIKTKPNGVEGLVCGWS